MTYEKTILSFLPDCGSHFLSDRLRRQEACHHRYL